MNPMLLTAGYRLTDAATIFGERSAVVLPAQAAGEAAETAASTGDPIFQALAILLFFCIALLVRDRLGMRVAVSSVSRGRLSDDFESGRRDAVVSDEFSNTAAVTGTLMIALAAAKYLALWLPESLVPVSWMRVPAAAAAAAAAVAATALWQKAVLKIAGSIGHNREFTELLLLVKRTFRSTVTLFVAPTVLLSALSRGDEKVWLWIVAAECFILLFLFLKETLLLFLRKKVPFFHWFLYLCAVEAFPLTLVCASIARLR